MNTINLDRTLETVGLWFFLMNFELVRSWTGSKEELVEKLYRKGSDADISGTRARVNAILRIIEAGLAEEALQKIKASERVNHDHPGADSIAEQILRDLDHAKTHPSPEEGVVCLRSHGDKSLDAFAEDWMHTAADALDAFPGGKVFLTYPQIILSEETPRHYRGKNDDTKVKEMLRALWDSYRKRRQLSREEARLTGCLLELSKGIDGSLPCYMDVRIGALRGCDAGAKALIARIDEILFTRRMEMLTFGTYNHHTDTITVYYKNQNQDDDESFLAGLRMTVANNIFRACHARLAGNLYDENSGEAEVIRDALAGWFAVDFCSDKQRAALDCVNAICSQISASDRRHTWFTYLRCDFPECCAWYMNMESDFSLLDNASEKRRFQKILEISRTDMKAAYRELIPSAEQRDFTVLRAEEGPAAGNAVVTDEVWNILKDLIARHNPRSLAEFNAIFPPDTVVIREGRTLMLESGVTVSGANQIDVIDLPALKDFAARDAFCCREGLSPDQFSELED